ncbi:bifunctional RNA recognition motif domain/Nucleotide-binding alpha-beta plait domain superfamily/Cyclophilin-RNA interacting protein/RNA-binding domain superfamily [Babesia duncani]|uniref:peptidylprolyl isomerase n=1 Tax=Babesia duncani TaxID=323732 RepID=A0AAD9PH26_9APIC|nr:bifunctional RNA recognition motif domain/Nucleotide-binding alpha-beta plait domain superfamily/Cyclophilin-RNA interacting protein/RNA-binding domain superfamily [Babesia duncani]KAK2194731.1 bifunctional RNA recognition motif domain/Nucleotide-binding alpha-beta plait domain superfamily/Cyclophilin-RNA interacting protein/RNA-binding domain superfamily [Babesia duncani]KAK2197972.1 bifunctional RNA recognition motif domain/Nucleotide-binding alpha-beta plait domain superfamily/Cyclophilin-R
MDAPIVEKEALAKEYKSLEELKSREAKSRAVVLEILGDIPDADVAPPKNVLFVCKLNPVTNQDDLRIIFSRFGTIKSCDIIKDYKTGDSLQYGFVEFETEDACNQAFFKMQNVLIDDRRYAACSCIYSRIHVDFCQSVAGYWKRFQDGKGVTRKHRPDESRHRRYKSQRDQYKRLPYRKH